MRSTAFAVFFFCCTILIRLDAFAASYTDDMDRFDSDRAREYWGLTHYYFSPATLAVIPDQTTASFSGGNMTAYAQYRVTGATNVVAYLYSHGGTFVSRRPGDSTYMMGVFAENMEFLTNMNVRQALLCEANGEVYTLEGGLKQLHTDMDFLFFDEVVVPPQGELIGYGVDIYYSYDGQDFIRSEPLLSKLQYDTLYGYCYEGYTAPIPESAKYIRVMLTDMSAVRIAGGGIRIKDRRYASALASVTITGDSLVMGEPEEEIKLPIPSSSSEYTIKIVYDRSYPEEAASKPESGKEKEEEEKQEKTPEKSSAPPSSKFEGVIASSPNPERETASKASKQTDETRKDSSSSSPDSEPEPEYVPDKTVVYNIEGGGGGDAFNKGVTAYVIVAGGALFAMVVLQKR